MSVDNNMIVEAEKRMDPSAVLEMLHEFFLDKRVMNITYSPVGGGGYMMLCGPAVDETTPPIKVATIDIQSGWGSNLEAGKYYVRVHSALILRIPSAGAYAATNRETTAESYLSLEDPEVFDKTLSLLEEIAVEYNKVGERWNTVDNSLFGTHLVWDGMTLNELKLRR